ncbi:MAG: family intrarane metalloprotease [Mucilaginibacter sp.]|nr:family intrarane metalloprotease [Mucilaginibacter sp.]
MVVITNWKTTAGDILMIFFVMVFPHIGLLPMFLYPFAVLGILWIYLKRQRQNFDSVGFRFRDLSLRSFVYGGMAGLVYAAVAFWLLAPLIALLGFAPANLHDFAFLRHQTKNYLYVLALACILVIPYEEIIFRGFIFSKIVQWFKWTSRPYLYSAIITSILFALYHYQEGGGAVLQIFIFALVQMVLFKAAKRNLWYMIFFHIVYDIFMLTAIWRGYL